MNGYGYIPEPIDPKAPVYDAIFGATTTTESFNWKPYLAPRENQGWIPFCVSFSRLNCAEAKAKKDGVDINLSDRYLGVTSHTSKSGNSLHQVSETFRSTGTVDEYQCTFTPEMLSEGWSYWDAINTLPDLSSAKKYTGGDHAWVYGKQAMIDALQYSPLQIALGLDRSYEIDKIVKTPKIATAYHAVCLYYIDKDGLMYIQDSCGTEFKILESDYLLQGVKSFRDLPANWKELNTPYVLKNPNIAKANPYAKANIAYVNALYKEAYGRYARPKELLRFVGIRVKDAANLILGAWRSPFYN